MTTKQKVASVETQYNAFKTKYPKHLCAFKVGDYYEFWNEDASIVGRVIGLPIINRRKDSDVKMCAIMANGAESIIARLLRSGFSVAAGEFKYA